MSVRLKVLTVVAAVGTVTSALIHPPSVSAQYVISARAGLVNYAGTDVRIESANRKHPAALHPP